MSTLENLQKLLEDVERNIRKLKDRLPAHSIKPGMMGELMALEDERDQILSELQSLQDTESS